MWFGLANKGIVCIMKKIINKRRSRHTKRKKKVMPLHRTGHFQHDFSSTNELMLEMELRCHDWLKKGGKMENILKILQYSTWKPQGSGISPMSHVRKHNLFEAEEMKLCITLSKSIHESNKGCVTHKTCVDWLIVKKSTINASCFDKTDNMLGLFSARTFKCKEIISIYIGDKIDIMSNKYSYKYGNTIVTINDEKNIPYYWGCHFSNDLLFGKSKQEKEQYMKNKKNRQNNAEFVGLMLVATGMIRVGQEIFTNYDNI